MAPVFARRSSCCSCWRRRARCCSGRACPRSRRGPTRPRQSVARWPGPTSTRGRRPRWGPRPRPSRHLQSRVRRLRLFRRWRAPPFPRQARSHSGLRSSWASLIRRRRRSLRSSHRVQTFRHRQLRSPRHRRPHRGQRRCRRPIRRPFRRRFPHRSRHLSPRRIRRPSRLRCQRPNPLRCQRPIRSRLRCLTLTVTDGPMTSTNARRCLLVSSQTRSALAVR